MIILGLTGSLAMGKSTVGAFFRAAGFPVYDADAHVHALYAGGLAETILKAFPEANREGDVDRAILGKIVFEDPQALKKLESLVHPILIDQQKSFLKQAEAAGVYCAVLDIPLLFETGRAEECDVVVVVSAAPSLQRKRALARTHMTEALFDAILARQMSDQEKRQLAHFVINTGGPKEQTEEQVAGICRAISGLRRGRKGR